MKANKKAQVWGIDLVVAVIIFTLGITVFSIYSLNQQGQAEEILEKLLKKHRIKATIFSEPENRDIKNGGEIYGSVDPFDGSMLYLRGFEHSWYTALSFFDKKRNPLCCGIADIINEKYYITEEGGNYLVSMDGEKKKKINPAVRKKLTEPIVLASYIMSSQYSPKFLDILVI